MRYHHQPAKIYLSVYANVYECDHPVYNKCTLYLVGNWGLGVIQQRYNSANKSTYWTEIDPWLVDELYLHEKFMLYFKQKAGQKNENGLYPTVTVRQIMWALRIKPIPRQPWETVFDKSPF